MRPEDLPSNKEKIGAQGESITGPSVIALGSGEFVVASLGVPFSTGVPPLFIFGSGGKEFSFTSSSFRTKVRIGRSLFNNVISPEGGVSNTHAEINKEQDNWRLYDLGSLNGTFMEKIAVIPADGEAVRIPKGEWRYIPTIDSNTVDVEIQFGSVGGRLEERDGNKFLTVGEESFLLETNVPHHVGSRDVPFAIEDSERGVIAKSINILRDGIDQRHALLIPLFSGVLIFDMDSEDGTHVRVTGQSAQPRTVFDAVDKLSPATMDKKSMDMWGELDP